MTELLHQRIVRIIKSIPKGRVATYGQIAALAGQPRAARQVARALHSSTRKENLPWQRVIGAPGRISLPRGGGFEQQRSLLLEEDVEVTQDGRVDLKQFQWKPRRTHW